MITVTIICPYCHLKQKAAVIPDNFQRVLCDVEQNGCDEYFAVEIEMEPAVKTYKLQRVKNEFASFQKADTHAH